MQSIRGPLGSIDTRVKMTDSPPNDLLSPSFASVLAFDDTPHYSTTALEDFRTLDFRPSYQHSTDRTDETVGDRDKERRHPRLELDVAFDNFHTLDGFAELLNPQNTPASFSGCNSPGEAIGRASNGNIRARSAPTTLAKGFSWSEDLHADLIDLPSDEDRDTQAGRCVSDARPPPSASSLYVMNGSQSTDEDGVVKGLVNNEFSPPRYVRFTQPSKPHQRQSSGFVQQPLRSMGQKQAFTPYRQPKRYDTWRRPTLTGAQRVPSYRSVGKSFHPSPIYEKNDPETRFSLRVKPVPRRDERSRSTSLESQDQTDPGKENLDMTGSLTSNSDPAKRSCEIRQACDIALITISLRHYRLPGTWRFNVLRVLIGTKISQATPVARKEAKRHIVTDIEANNLLFHVGFIGPAIVLRVAHIAVSIGQHFAHSRAGLAGLQLLKTLWSGFVRAIRILMLILGIHPIYWEFTVEHQRL